MTSEREVTTATHHVYTVDAHLECPKRAPNFLVTLRDVQGVHFRRAPRALAVLAVLEKHMATFTSSLYSLWQRESTKFVECHLRNLNLKDAKSIKITLRASHSGYSSPFRSGKKAARSK